MLTTNPLLTQTLQPLSSQTTFTTWCHTPSPAPFPTSLSLPTLSTPTCHHLTSPHHRLYSLHVTLHPELPLQSTATTVSGPTTKLQTPYHFHSLFIQRSASPSCHTNTPVAHSAAACTCSHPLSTELHQVQGRQQCNQTSTHFNSNSHFTLQRIPSQQTTLPMRVPLWSEMHQGTAMYRTMSLRRPDMLHTTVSLISGAR